MPNQEEIQQQRQLLIIYRRNLAQLLIQQAQLGGQAHTPIGIINSIQEARDCIQRIKTNLSNWGIYIEDSIDEEPFGGSQSVLSSVFPSGPYLQTFIGRDLKDSSLQILLKSFGKDVDINNYGSLNDPVFHGIWTLYTYKSSGISLRFINNTLNVIQLYAGRIDGFKRYNGKLPYGILWDDARTDVESKIGPPTSSSDSVSGNYVANYDHIGFGIVYDRLYTDDLSAEIYYVCFNKPKKK